VDEDGIGYDAITPLSFAYADLASKSLSFLARNESRLERVYHRALKTLLELQPRQPPTRNEKRETEREKLETRKRASSRRPTTTRQLTQHPPIR
jgi:hypothetical protein